MSSNSGTALVVGGESTPTPDTVNIPMLRLVDSHRRYDRDASSHLDVLLLDAQFSQTLACTRRYGQMGLKVATVACASEARWAPSLRSRWSSLRAVVPDVDEATEDFTAAVLSLVDRYRPSMILPAHDGSIDALRAHRTTIERTTAFPFAAEAALAMVVDKEQTLKMAAAMGIGVPQSFAVVDASDVRRAVEQVGLPAVIKPARSWNVDQGGFGSRRSAELVMTEADAVAMVDEMRSLGCNPIMQSWLPGRREAITVFYAEGRFWTRFAQRSHREWPVVGGTSVLCESIPLPPDITECTDRLIETIGLEGCSMVEFRRDASGRPLLMEINPRMGASVGLAMACGVDLPGLLHAFATGQALWAMPHYQSGRRLRRVSDDLRNLKRAFVDHNNPESPSAGHATAAFVADFVRPGLVRPAALSDPRPPLLELGKLFSEARLGVRRRRRGLDAGGNDALPRTPSGRARSAG